MSDMSEGGDATRPTAPGAEPGRSAPPADPATAPPGWRELVAETAQCLRFYSRLPIPTLSFERDPHAAPDFTRLPRALPMAGAILGAVGGLALLAGTAAGLPPLLAATLAVTAEVITTGCFGEDGLADACDGLFGGATPERRLAIMSDSRVGSYGVAGLALVLLLRVAALSALAAGPGPLAAAGALVAAGSLSRLAGVVPLWALPPAKREGRSASVGRPTDATMRFASLAGTAIALLVLAPLHGASRTILAVAAAAATAFLMTRLARRKLGGQTGDIAGATQQVAEVAVLVALCVGTGPGLGT